MKPFKKRGFWVLFVFVVLVGAFFIVNSGLKNQSPVIPNVEAQIYGASRGYDSGGTGFGGMMPQNIMFSQDSGPVQETRSSFPGNVMFSAQLFPGSVMFSFPGDVMGMSSKGKTEMRTIMTCSGCAITMTTCDWNCGRTFSFCNTGNICGDSFTGLTCPGPTGLSWGDGGHTNIVCPTGTICGIGGNTNIACPTGIICGRDGNTLLSCSTNLSGCGQTGLFCLRQPALYGGGIGYGRLYSGSRTMSGIGCSGMQLYGGIGSLGIAPNPTPSF